MTFIIFNWMMYIFYFGVVSLLLCALLQIKGEPVKEIVIANAAVICQEEPDIDDNLIIDETLIVKKGLLLKRSLHLKFWNPRECVIKGRLFIHFQGTKQRGSIEIKNGMIKIIEASDHDYQRPFSFILMTKDETFHLAAVNAEDRDDWIEHLQRQIQLIELCDNHKFAISSTVNAALNKADRTMPRVRSEDDLAADLAPPHSVLQTPFIKSTKVTSSQITPRALVGFNEPTSTSTFVVGKIVTTQTANQPVVMGRVVQGMRAVENTNQSVVQGSIIANSVDKGAAIKPQVLTFGTPSARHDEDSDRHDDNDADNPQHRHAMTDIASCELAMHYIQSFSELASYEDIHGHHHHDDILDLQVKALDEYKKAVTVNKELAGERGAGGDSGSGADDNDQMIGLDLSNSPAETGRPAGDDDTCDEEDNIEPDISPFTDSAEAEDDSAPASSAESNKNLNNSDSKSSPSAGLEEQPQRAMSNNDSVIAESIVAVIDQQLATSSRSSSVDVSAPVAAHVIDNNNIAGCQEEAEDDEDDLLHGDAATVRARVMGDQKQLRFSTMSCDARTAASLSSSAVIFDRLESSASGGDSGINSRRASLDLRDQVKWRSYLLNSGDMQQAVLATAVVGKRNALGIMCMKQLILTSEPRLLYVDQADSNKVTIISLSDNMTNRMEKVSNLAFKITSADGVTHKFIDNKNGSQYWLYQIQKAVHDAKMAASISKILSEPAAR